MFRFDVFQHSTETLALGDRGVRHALILDEDGVGDRDTLPTHIESTVRKGICVALLAWQAVRVLILSQEDPFMLIGEGKLRTNKSFVAETEHIPG